MIRALTAMALLLGACSQALALPVPGYNTIETHCGSYGDRQVDPIKSFNANNPWFVSAHMHTMYGLSITASTSAKPIGDAAQITNGSFDQIIPGGGAGPYHDLGYGPLSSSCTTYGDWAAYWIPTPSLSGFTGSTNRGSGAWNTAPRVVGFLTLTWGAPNNALPVYEPPFGMEAVVGNATATSEAQQDNAHVSWTCGGLLNGTTKPQDCTGSEGVVTAVVSFPDCYDGQAQYPNFDHPAGIDKSHFSYSSLNAQGVPTCGTGSFLITKLWESVHFHDNVTGLPLVNPLNADGSVRLTFSSGPYYTFHADFLNTWNIGLAWFNAGCNDGQTLYGGFQSLIANGLPACNTQGAGEIIRRCPQLSDPGDFTLWGAKYGLKMCKDQDVP